MTGRDYFFWRRGFGPRRGEGGETGYSEPLSRPSPPAACNLIRHKKVTHEKEERGGKNRKVKGGDRETGLGSVAGRQEGDRKGEARWVVGRVG